MANGNSMIEIQDHMEQTGCSLEEALETVQWYDAKRNEKWFEGRSIQPITRNEQDETLPF